MAITFVQYAQPIALSGASVTVANGLGDLLVAVVRSNGSNLSISDTAGNVWVPIKTSSGSTNKLIAYVSSAKLSASNVISRVATGETFGDIMFVEYSGFGGPAIVDQSSVATGSSTAPSVGPVSTTSVIELILGAGLNDSTGAHTDTAGSGYTLRSPSSQTINTGTLEDQVSSVTGSFSATATYGSSVAWTWFIATFAASSAYSVPDCRNSYCGLVPTTNVYPNGSVNVQGTLTYTVETSNNPAIPPVDSRTAGAPVDSRVSPNIPQNSRTPGVFGPGE
jgi:hypothetical protein